jgi:pimeloyl-ACP methyl ester carboxylesterase
MNCSIFKSLFRARRLAATSLSAVMMLAAPGIARSQAGLKTYTGSFPDHATYLIEMPKDWNGTLFLYSHGYAPPDTPNPPTDYGDNLVRLYFLTKGYALAGSSYAGTGWAVEDALRDQIAVLDTFDRLVGHPRRTIAWGHSLGGITTAGLIQNHPERFSGAVALCGVVAGGPGIWNQLLDSAFAFNTLLASGQLQIVHIADPVTNLTNAETILNKAQSTSQGQARIALVAALVDSPGWIDPLSPPPNPTDYTTLEANQFVSLGSGFDFPLYFAFRAELEKRAGGNPSWNTGVDYQKQLNLSIGHAEVESLYKQAGLSLAADLKMLNNAARIGADPVAVNYLSQNIALDGEIQVPVLTVHTVGDDIVNVQNEQAYAAIVHKAGHDSLLRETFVHRAGHCWFTSAETIAALQALIRRLDTGEWQGTDAKTLNAAASALPLAYDDINGPGGQLLPPAFTEYAPAPFLRPYDDVDEGSGKR